MPPDFDCLVVGAGLVGSAAAIALAKCGYSVCVVERRAAPAGDQGDARALVLSAASVEILKPLSLWSELQTSAYPIRRIRVSDRGGLASAELDADDIARSELGWSYPADRLLHHFNAQLSGYPGIESRWAAKLVSTSVVNDRVVASVEQAGVISDLSCRLLLGADGVESLVRELADIEVDQIDYQQHAVVATVTVGQAQPHVAFEHFTRRGPIAMIPTGDAGYVSVQCLDTDAAEVAMLDDDRAYLASLQRRFGRRLGPLETIGGRRKHALLRRRARQIAAPRTLLIGNAANTVHPNGAQGLNLALRDVATLQTLLAEQDDPGAELALHAYAEARRTDHQKTGALTDLLAQSFRSRLAVVRCLRRGGLMLAAHSKSLRTRLILEASGLNALNRAGYDG